MCRIVIASAILIAALCTASPAASAQGCCGSFRPRSILAELADAEIILVGTFQNGVKPNNAMPNGQVEFKIDSVLKPHAIVMNRKVVTLPRHIESGKKYLIAATVTKGEFDAYLGRELDANGEMERFVRGALQLKDKSDQARLEYCAGFLLNAHKDVITSAVLEFTTAEYETRRKLARTLNPDDFIKPLLNPATAPEFRAAYAQIVGHAGKKEHAVFLAKLLDANDAKDMQYWPELFVAYVQLDPEAGRKRILQILDKLDAPFLVRYSAFDAVRRLRDTRPDLMNAKQARDAVAKLLPDGSMADFAIESLRVWKCWDACDDVLALVHSKKHQMPIVKRAILRYAMQCPNPQAKAHVIQMQAQDAEWVQDTRELLEIETGPLPK